MQIQADSLAELQLLCQFNLDSMQEGLKVHHTADDGAIAACQRLYDKGLVSLPDGGYLTDRGIEAAMKIQSALALLQAEPLRDMA